ncbi:hypothetical protein F4821DRAFT_244467 [Hypoxylon rubiginosum]|uniref:Uncharacterized protein n=1 Tax=Hypoxylon rubiginosum TaxID=110542 RepID=A0ACC0CTL0_9PEZI|nr:hypothetical protein F4821DRAFT_244467 [Hypoxylon rubiginosum]
MAPEAQTTESPEETKDFRQQPSSEEFIRPTMSEIVRPHVEEDIMAKEERVSHCAEAENEIRNPADNGKSEYKAEIQRDHVVVDTSTQTEYCLVDRGVQSNETEQQVVKDVTKRTSISEEKSIDHSHDNIETAVAKMKEGDCGYIRQYLESSPERDVFLYANEDTWRMCGNGSVSLSSKGDTALHIAARREHPEILKLLLDKGANPNVPNLKGRTPLAEAALFGRFLNVEHLLDHGANVQIACTRNGVPVFAIDFARDLQINVQERRKIQGYWGQECYEDQENRGRKQIVALLERKMSESDTGSYVVESFRFMESDSLELTFRFRLKFQQKKTLAVLYNNRESGIATSMSGWAEEAYHEINTQIPGRRWTEEVRQLCKSIRYNGIHH